MTKPSHWEKARGAAEFWSGKDKYMYGTGALTSCRGAGTKAAQIGFPDMRVPARPV